MSKRKYMIFDVETNGLPMKKSYDEYYCPKKIKFYDTSRIIEIGYIICDRDKIMKEYSSLIKPDGFDIKNTHIHGITDKYARKEGIDMKEFLEIFKKDLKEIDSVVSHNIDFDSNVMLSEIYRYDELDIYDIFKTKKKYCTMKIAKKLYNLERYPKLKNLYKALFNKIYKQTHRALDDVVICKQIFFRLQLDIVTSST